MNKCCIRSHAHFPVPGGWGVKYYIKGQAFHAKAVSPERVVEQIIKTQIDNDIFKGEDEVWSTCNAVWAQRAPDRVLREFRELYDGTALPSDLTPRIPNTDHQKIDPAYYGPILWHWLHFFGHNFDKAQWDFTIQRVTDILNPEKSPLSGCPTCFSEFRGILQFMPPSEVQNEEDAAKWTFTVHNMVNKRLQKPIRGWAQMARLYGWKVTL